MDVVREDMLYRYRGQREIKEDESLKRLLKKVKTEEEEDSHSMQSFNFHHSRSFFVAYFT